MRPATVRRAVITSIALAYLSHMTVAEDSYNEGINGPMYVYRYAYHKPTDLSTQACNGKVPVIFSLGGINSFRRPGEDVRSTTLEDSLGRLLSEYVDDPKEPRRKVAYEQVLTILPNPEYDASNQHYDPKMLDGVYDNVMEVFGDYIDSNRIYYVGYSDGCRGAIRWAISNPARPAGMICVGGGAEKSPNPVEIVKKFLTNLEGRYYGWRLTQAMPETFTKLKTLKDLPIYIVSGGDSDKVARGDLDHPPEAALATYNALPNKEIVKYIDLNTDHDALSMAPYTTDKVNLIEWLLKQRKGECSAVRGLSKSLNGHRIRRWGMTGFR